MKNFLLATNIVLIVLVGVLFYLHFSGSPKKVTVASSGASVPDTSTSGFRIAYFEMDSIEYNYNYLSDVKKELKAKENQLSAQLDQMKRGYYEKVNKFQRDAQTMSAERQGAMQQELMQQQKVIGEKEQALGQELQDLSFKKMQAVNKKIEDYLKEFNKDKGYAFILAYQPGTTFYYKDGKYDVTGPMLKGLNDEYKKK